MFLRVLRQSSSLAFTSRLAFLLAANQEVVVDEFDEILQLSGPTQLIFGHRFGDYPGVTVDSSNKNVAVRSVIGTIIILFDDNCLLSSVFSLEDNHDFVLFHKLTHLALSYKATVKD